MSKRDRGVLGRLSLTVPLVLASALCHCASSSPACSGSGVTPIEVLVVDDATSRYICNAIVTATSGAVVVTVRGANQFVDAGLSDNECPYSLGPTESGSYTVAAEAGGYVPASQGNVSIQIEHDSCGAFATSTQFVTLRMRRSP